MLQQIQNIFLHKIYSYRFEDEPMTHNQRDVFKNVRVQWKGFDTLLILQYNHTDELCETYIIIHLVNNTCHYRVTWDLMMKHVHWLQGWWTEYLTQYLSHHLLRVGLKDFELIISSIHSYNFNHNGIDVWLSYLVEVPFQLLFNFRVVNVFLHSRSLFFFTHFTLLWLDR